MPRHLASAAGMKTAFVMDQAEAAQVTNRIARFTPYCVSFLLVLGFGLHLSNLGQYLAHGQTRLRDIVTPTFDGALTAWMGWCAALLIFGARGFFAEFDVRGWRKGVYWVVTFYVTASIPGHLRYLVTRDTTYFDIFPWWFSPLIMIVYVAFIAYFVSLRPSRLRSCEGAGASHPREPDSQDHEQVALSRRH
jgi:hypothetical protein